MKTEKKLKPNALNVIFHNRYLWTLQKFSPKIFFQFFKEDLDVVFSLILEVRLL